MREFKIDALPDIQFREANVSPVELLALSTQVDFDKFQKTKEIFQFSLEHIECLIENVWTPVKYPGREIYMPAGIEKNFKALNELCLWYTTNVITEVFTDSAE